MTHARDGYVVRTRDRDGALGDYRVSWVIGGKRMQDPLTIFPDGRWQVLPVYYHVTGKRWVDYNEEKQGRVGPEHPFFWTNFRRNANHECLDCHTTGLDVRYDAASHAWSTHFADAGVACEDCHGEYLEQVGYDATQAAPRKKPALKRKRARVPVEAEVPSLATYDDDQTAPDLDTLTSPDSGGNVDEVDDFDDSTTVEADAGDEAEEEDDVEPAAVDEEAEEVEEPAKDDEE